MNGRRKPVFINENKQNTQCEAKKLYFLHPECGRIDKKIVHLQRFCVNTSLSMSSSETLTIDLRKATDAPLGLQQTLGDQFFASLEQDEILGGEIEVAIHVKAQAGDSFRVSVDLHGAVRTICDRCLEEVTLPVEAHEQMTIRYGEETTEQDDEYDVTVIPFTATTYDMSWDVYEFTALALPMQRTHPDGECNADMAQYIVTEA